MKVSHVCTLEQPRASPMAACVLLHRTMRIPRYLEEPIMICLQSLMVPETIYLM